MTTDHDTLIELQPLLRELGWWPWSLRYSEGQWRYVNALEPHKPSIPFDPSDALAIVTQRAEKELCGRGWMILKQPKPHLPTYWKSEWDTIKPTTTGVINSLADALRVELTRQDTED